MKTLTLAATGWLWASLCLAEDASSRRATKDEISALRVQSGINATFIPAAPGEIALPSKVLCLALKYSDGSSLLKWRDYETKDVISQYFDAAGKKLSEEVLESAPLPLAEEELKLARQVVSRKGKEVSALGGDAAPERILPSTISDKSDPRYRHRVVNLWYKGPVVNGRARRVSVKVDLDTREVLEERVSEGPARGADVAPLAPGEVSEPSALHRVEQKFPINGGAGTPQTAWRIEFQVESHAGGSKVLAIKKAEYVRSVAENDVVEVLDDCRLAEIYVPYNDGSTEFYDIVADSFNFGLQKLAQEDLGPACLGTPEVLSECIAKELHDGNLMWMNDSGKTARGQKLDLWAVLSAGNYRYKMLYSFHADGTVEMSIGPTAHNFFFGSEQKNDIATHLHVGCWRISPVLNDAKAVAVKEVKYISTPATGAKSRTEVVPFNEGREGGITLKPAEFTVVRLESTTQKNKHLPEGSYIGYDVLTRTFGATRRFGNGMEWTQNDFWVTWPRGLQNQPLLEFHNVHRAAEARRPLAGQSVVIWHHSGLIHRPRDEDFGPIGANPTEGVALANYVGVILKPRNLHSQTPLYAP